MKTLMIILSVLVLSTAVYSYNPMIRRKYQKFLSDCAKELGSSETDVNVIFCAKKKEGHINEKGEFIMKKIIPYAEEILPNSLLTKAALMLFANCRNQAIRSGATGTTQSLRMIKCIMPIFLKVGKS